MRKRLWPVLLAAVLLLCACTTTPQSETMVQPVRFYYRTAETDFSAQDGILCAELRDLGSKTYTDTELFQLYFHGPIRKDLISPIGADTTLDSVERIKNNTLVFYLTRSKDSPAAFNHALTYACLAKTALELDNVREVQFHVALPDGTVEEKIFTQDDLLLYDTGETPQTIEVTLYYSDESGNLLLTEKRQILPVSDNTLPMKALELLLSPPKSSGMKSALPSGTVVQDLRLSDGICTVDLNSAFFNNRPKTEQAEQLAVLSVVNTLCELDGISAVQLLSEGKKLDRYVNLDLSHPWSQDDAVVGPVRNELGDFIGVLCLPDEQKPLLHRLAVRARAKIRSASKESTLLMTLMNRASQNGLMNLLSNSEAPVSVSTNGAQCLVILPRSTLPTDALLRQLALRSITATLCTLPEINEVVIWEEDDLLTFKPMSPQENWFYVSSDRDPSSSTQIIS